MNHELHDKETEEAVLGAMMFDNSIIPQVLKICGEDGVCFFHKAHQLIYRAIVECYDQDRIVDPLIVSSALDKKQQLKRAGDNIYLYDLESKVVETASTEVYARILRELGTRRQLLALGGWLQQAGQNEEIEIPDLISQAQDRIFDLNQRQDEGGFVRISHYLDPLMEQIEAANQQNELFVGLQTGFVDLDLMTSGLQNGDLIIVAARPSMGKSTFVTNIAQYVAIEKQLPVGLFSIEMPQEQVAMRMLSAEAHLSFHNIRTGGLYPDDWAPLTQAVTSLVPAPIYINDSKGSIADVHRLSLQLKNEIPDLALLIIDYLQLMRGSGRYQNGRVEEVSDISRRLKSLAKELDIPLIAVSQLSRDVEKRPDKRPQLSDLRESGAIEQDADLVAFLYREDYYDTGADEQGIAELMIKKNRNGPTGTVRLEFNKAQMRFANLTA